MNRYGLFEFKDKLGNSIRITYEIELLIKAELKEGTAQLIKKLTKREFNSLRSLEHELFTIWSKSLDDDE